MFIFNNKIDRDKEMGQLTNYDASRTGEINLRGEIYHG